MSATSKYNIVLRPRCAREVSWTPVTIRRARGIGLPRLELYLLYMKRNMYALVMVQQQYVIPVFHHGSVRSSTGLTMTRLYSTLRNADPHASPESNSSLVGCSLRFVVQSTHPRGRFMETPPTAPCSRSSFSTCLLLCYHPPTCCVTHRHGVCFLVPNSLIVVF